MADFRNMVLGETLFSTNTFTNLTLDSSTVFLAFIAQAEEAATITELGFRQGTVTGTSPVYKIGFQTRGADGEPDGTYLGGGSEQSAEFTPVGGNNSTWVWITLDNARSVTRGEVLCIVIEYVSGTVNGSNNVSISRTNSRVIANIWNIPYNATATGGVWTLQDDYPLWGMKTSSRSYGDMVQALAQINYDAADTPDEHGNAFTMPDDSCDSFQILGAVWTGIWLDPGASNNIILALYNDTTLLQEISLEGRMGSVTAESNHTMYFDEATLTDLSPGTEYIISIRPDDTVVLMAMMQDTFSALQDLRGCKFAWPGWTARHAERTNAGAWTLTDTEFMRMRLILKDITEPAVAGGISTMGGYSRRYRPRIPSGWTP